MNNERKDGYTTRHQKRFSGGGGKRGYKRPGNYYLNSNLWEVKINWGENPATTKDNGGDNMGDQRSRP